MDLHTMEERLLSRRYYITLNMFAADFYKMVKNCQVRARGPLDEALERQRWACSLRFACAACRCGSTPRLVCNALLKHALVDSCCSCLFCPGLHLYLALLPPCVRACASAAVQWRTESVLPGLQAHIRYVLGRHAQQHPAQPRGGRHSGAQALTPTNQHTIRQA